MMRERVIKAAATGEAVGVVGVGRWLATGQRAAMLADLTAEAEVRAAAVLADARSAAASILADAESQADAVHRRAYREGYSEGHAEGSEAGHAQAMAEVTPLAELLRAATDHAEAVRLALLDGVEEQAVALAMAAARRVVGAAAESYAGLAASAVRQGLRSAPGRVVRVLVNPADVESVSVSLLRDGTQTPVQADDAVSVGGCVISVEGGTVDLTLEAQIESVVRAVA